MVAGKWNTNTGGKESTISTTMCPFTCQLFTDNVAQFECSRPLRRCLRPSALSRPPTSKILSSLKDKCWSRDLTVCVRSVGRKTCWVTLSNGKTVGIKADDLSYVSGKVDLSFYSTGP